MQTLKRIIKELHSLKSCKINTDKLNLFMAKNKGYISKVYNFAIIRQFLKIMHPRFENRWSTVSKWHNRVDDIKVRVILKTRNKL